MAEDEQIIKAPPEAVKKGGYCMIRGMPCKLEICEVLPKATANGNKRLHIRGPNVFTVLYTNRDLGGFGRREALRRD